MANSIDFPLSGAVNQSWDFWLKSVSSQMGFINIRNVSSSDHEIEQKIVEDIAGYGRQLGKINAVLMAIIENPELKDLTAGEEQALNDFTGMVTAIQAIKGSKRSPDKLMTAIDLMISEIRSLRVDNKSVYTRAVKRVRDGLEI